MHVEEGSVKALVIEFAEASSFHGIPNVARAKHTTLRVMWLLALLPLAAICCQSFKTGLLDYLAFKVNVNLESVSELVADFPMITLCNFNSYNSNDALEMNRGILNAFNVSDITELATENIDQAISLVKYYALAHIVSPLIEKYDEAAKGDLKSLGYPLDKMLISCNYKLVPCTMYDFKWSYSLNYGNCYKFNYNITEVKKTYRSGKDVGLTLELWVDDPVDPNLLSVSRGIHIYIDKQTTKVPYMLSGLDAAANTQTDIGIERYFRSKLGPPYSPCIANLTSRESHTSEFFQTTLKIFHIYSQQQCLDVCMQRFFINKCNCSSALLPLLGIPACSTAEDINCTFHQYNIFNINRSAECSDQVCPPECETIKFKTTMSFASYPTLAYYNTNLQEHPKVIELFGTNASYEYVRRHLLKLNIFYSTLTYEHLRDKPSQNLLDFVSSTGGTIGLYIGASLMSYFEIIDLALLLIFHKIQRFKRRDAELITTDQMTKAESLQVEMQGAKFEQTSM